MDFSIVAPCWMLHTIPASECITYDVSYVLVLVASSPCPWSWESSTWPLKTSVLDSSLLWWRRICMQL